MSNVAMSAKKMHKLWAFLRNIFQLINDNIFKRIKLQVGWLSRRGLITELTYGNLTATSSRLNDSG